MWVGRGTVAPGQGSTRLPSWAVMGRAQEHSHKGSMVAGRRHANLFHVPSNQSAAGCHASTQVEIQIHAALFSPLYKCGRFCLCNERHSCGPVWPVFWMCPAIFLLVSAWASLRRFICAASSRRWADSCLRFAWWSSWHFRYLPVFPCLDFFAAVCSRCCLYLNSYCISSRQLFSCTLFCMFLPPACVRKPWQDGCLLVQVPQHIPVSSEKVSNVFVHSVTCSHAAFCLYWSLKSWHFWRVMQWRTCWLSHSCRCLCSCPAEWGLPPLVWCTRALASRPCHLQSCRVCADATPCSETKGLVLPALSRTTRTDYSTLATTIAIACITVDCWADHPWHAPCNNNNNNNNNNNSNNNNTFISNGNPKIEMFTISCTICSMLPA